VHRGRKAAPTSTISRPRGCRWLAQAVADDREVETVLRPDPLIRIATPLPGRTSFTAA